MLQETMKAVEEAEAKAADMVNNAESEADSIIAAARTEAARVSEQTQAQTKTDQKSAETLAKKAEKDMVDKAIQEAEGQIKNLKAKALEKEGETVDMIIGALV